MILYCLTNRGSAALATSGTAAQATAAEMSAAGPTSAQRRAALALLALWLVATVTGRLLAYTHTILMARDAQFY